ncbi:MAG: glycosyltransferase family A protein [Candidatus Paceibacterota bacterium]
MQKNNELKISLVIPAYNEEKYIGECLDCAIRNSKGKINEIIVVDNASTDKTSEIAISKQGIRVIKEERKGNAWARERGFREASGDIIAFIDADTLMTENWPDIILCEFKNPKIVCLSGPYSYYDIPRWKKTFVNTYWILAMPIYFIVGYMAIGGNLAIRRVTLKKMGGINTSISFYGDDTDIARRASKFGKVKFKYNFLIYSSARRLVKDGFFKTVYLYVINFFSQVFIHRPVTKEYKDIR